MFTSKSIILLIAIVVLLMIAWNTDITMVYIFFLISFVIFVLSFIHLQFNIPNILVRREAQGTAFEDDVINVNITIENKGLLSRYFFELVDRFTGSQIGKEDISLFILNIRQKEIKNISYMLSCYKRGLHELGPISMIAQDALGFFKMRKSFNVFSEILVYPSLFRIFSFPMLASSSISWMGVETAQISGDSHEFFGIREYQKGDAMSRIHWPSTAHHNRLIVKQFERNAIQEITIIIDLKKSHDIGIGRDTTLEYAVKIACSISRYLLNRGAFVQIVGYGKKPDGIPFGKGESHLYRILDFLANVKSDGDYSLTQVLDETSFITPQYSTLIVAILDTDVDALSSLVQFKIRAIRLIVIVLNSGTFGNIDKDTYIDKRIANRFDEILIGLEAYVYKISKGDDLEKRFSVV